MTKVLWHLTMSLDGFIASKDHSWDWLSKVTFNPGVFDEMVATTGAILAGRRWHDRVASGVEIPPYGGAWSGPVFVLTHHPEDAAPVEGTTFLNCDVAEAVQIALAAAGGKNLEVFGADLARQCLAGGLIDEFYLHLAPVMLGSGLRLFERPGIDPVCWALQHDGDPAQAVDLRYRPVRTGQA
jgi:dihydrofolate reductase